MTKIKTDAKAIEAAKKELDPKVPERFSISSYLLNELLGVASTFPAHVIMELITKVQMDLRAVPDEVTEDSQDDVQKDAPVVPINKETIDASV